MATALVLEREKQIEAAGLKPFADLMEDVAKLPKEEQKEVTALVTGFMLRGKRKQITEKVG